MINFVLTHLEILSFIIALSALLISVYSVIYTHRFNKRCIDVDECYVDSNGAYPLVSLRINNMSPMPIRVRSLVFSDSSGEVVAPLNYVPELTPLQLPEFSDPLRQDTTLEPHGDLDVSYFFEDSDEIATVTVFCKERIHHLRKCCTFELDLVDID